MAAAIIVHRQSLSKRDYERLLSRITPHLASPSIRKRRSRWHLYAIVTQKSCSTERSVDAGGFGLISCGKRHLQLNRNRI